MNYIPYGKQCIDKDDIDAVVSVLKSEWLTQGPAIVEFERGLAAYTGSTYAVAVSNGTAALHLACMALGLGKGDILWTTPNTFVASANCGLYCGAEIDFVDIELEYYNMCVIALEEKLKLADKIGKLPKVVVPVHFAGQPCDMQTIKRLSEKYGFYVIEDACHAIGATYKNNKVGNCQYSDMTVFSFHPVKIITAGEGGAVVTNNPDLYEKVLQLRTHGITKDIKKISQDHGPWYYEQQYLGFNYRITDIQAALGLSQLSKIDKFIAARHIVLEKYQEILSDLPLLLPKQKSDNLSSLHLYPILVKDVEVRRELFEHLREHNIGVNVHYIPVYKQPFYQKLGFAIDYCSCAEYYYNREITLPMFPDLNQLQIDYIAECIKSANCMNVLEKEVL